MNREAQERLAAAAACDGAIPGEMVCGETTRIDQTALTGLLEKSEGIAIGTPKGGLPVLDEPEIEMIADESAGNVVAVGESVVEVGVGEVVVEVGVGEVEVGVAEAVVSEAVIVAAAGKRPSRARDVLIGGVLSLLVMAAWYCSTQL
jgi:hypothetical protein